jgi:hypothetical protein
VQRRAHESTDVKSTATIAEGPGIGTRTFDNTELKIVPSGTTVRIISYERTAAALRLVAALEVPRDEILTALNAEPKREPVEPVNLSALAEQVRALPTPRK